MPSEIVSSVTTFPYPQQRVLTGGVIGAGRNARVPTALGAATILAPPVATDGSTFAVEDADGSAVANPITINGNGNTIDGAATFVMNTANGSVSFAFDGTEWKQVILTRSFEIPNLLSVPFIEKRQLTAAGVGGSSAASQGAINTVQTSDGAGAFLAATNVLAQSNQISFPAAGTVPAIGNIRFPNGSGAVYLASKTGGGTDYELLSLNGSGEILLGPLTASLMNFQIRGSSGVVFANGLLDLYGSGAILMTLGTGLVQNGGPVVGRSTVYGSHGQTAAITTAGGRALAAAEYSREAIRFTTTATGTFTLPLPASDDAAYSKVIMNETAGTITISLGAGTTVNVLLTTVRKIWCSAAGVVFVT